MSNMSDLQIEMESISWYHTIDLGNGLITPGSSHSDERLACLKLPTDLAGLHVLDIGAWDGMISFECENRGAARVVALDSYVWGEECMGAGRGFDFAKRVLNSNVEKCVCEVQDISPVIGMFDVVIFSQIFYHMRHPLWCLERLASVAKPGALLVMETVVDMLEIKRPAMAFYPGAELCEDWTNWCGPNSACIYAMLEDVGFRDFTSIAEIRMNEPMTNDPTTCHGRLTLHARRNAE